MPAERLTSHEHAALGNLATAVDCRRVRLYRSGTPGGAGLLRGLVLWFSRNRAVALGNHVFLPQGCERDLPVLAHELTHCAQYQSWGRLAYLRKGGAAQARELLYRKAGIGSSPYPYTADPGKPFTAYGIEQQGQIVEDCFRGHPPARAISPFHPGREPPNHAVPSA
jgi:Domain of unknown function (DUF4157)